MTGKVNWREFLLKLSVLRPLAPQPKGRIVGDQKKKCVLEVRNVIDQLMMSDLALSKCNKWCTIEKYDVSILLTL